MSDSETFCGEVAAKWLPRGVWLSRAWHELGDPRYVGLAREQAARFAELRGNGDTVENFTPAALPDAPAGLLALLHWEGDDLWNLSAQEKERWGNIAAFAI